MPRNYTIEDLSRALAAVEHSGISLREASQTHNVPFATLQRHRKSNLENGTKGVQKVKPGPAPALAEFENELMEVINSFNDAGHPLTRIEVIRIAKEIDSKRPDNERKWKDKEKPSGMWYKRFTKRHNLALQCTKNKALKRSHPSIQDVRQEIFNRYNALLAKHKFTPEVIYDMDEIEMQINTKTHKVVRKGSKLVVSRKPGERDDIISVACCANAAGTVILPPFVIFKDSVFNTNMQIDTYPVGTAFACSEGGHMESELFVRWLEIFVQKIPPTRPVLLLYGGHESNVQNNALEFCKKNSIKLCSSPSHTNTTHLYQPLDKAFKALKESYQHSVATYLRKNKCKVNETNFGEIFAPSYLKSVTPFNIVSGFKEAGFWKATSLNNSSLLDDAITSDYSDNEPSFWNDERQDYILPEISFTPDTKAVHASNASHPENTPSNSCTSDQASSKIITDVIKDFLNTHEWIN